MKKLLTLGAVALIAATVSAFATAAVGWRVFATAMDQGEFATYASANAKVLNPNALAVRARGPVESVSWSLSCDGETKAAPGVLSNRAVVVSVAASKSCTVYGSAFGEAGTLRVQLLRR